MRRLPIMVLLALCLSILQAYGSSVWSSDGVQYEQYEGDSDSLSTANLLEILREQRGDRFDREPDDHVSVSEFLFIMADQIEGGVLSKKDARVLLSEVVEYCLDSDDADPEVFALIADVIFIVHHYKTGYPKKLGALKHALPKMEDLSL